MTSGDMMKKHVTVRQKNCTDQSLCVLHDGVCEYTCEKDQITLSYREKEGGEVVLKADAKELMIFRKGDVTSRLRFRRDTNTTATITSPYGSFEIALYTYFYRISEQMIVVEYDVLSDMREKTRLRFSWHIKGACS